MSKSTTYNIDVQVKTTYLEGQSAPSEGRYVFTYSIRIHNLGTVGAKLLTRHWIITDANGTVEEVHGPGVIGEQPRLAAGGSYEYSSGVILKTPIGSMQGSYQMLADDGTAFDASIPIFTLAVPRVLH